MEESGSLNRFDVIVRELTVFDDLEQLYRRATAEFIEVTKLAAKDRGSAVVALSGGSTPKALYSLLATEVFAKQLPLEHIYFFIGDERCVPANSPESNFGMARSALFEPLSIDADHTFPWPTELPDANGAAKLYGQRIVKVFDKLGREDTIPRFDLILLGMGSDGHTASLFPFSPALIENDRITAANPVEKLQSNRLTFTFPLLNHAANVMFLVAGSDKADAAREVLEGEFRPDAFPAQAVNPLDGRLVWLLDQAAAAGLES